MIEERDISVAMRDGTRLASGGVTATDLVMLDIAMELYKRCRCSARFCKHGSCFRRRHRITDARVRGEVSRAFVPMPREPSASEPPCP